MPLSALGLGHKMASGFAQLALVRSSKRKEKVNGNCLSRIGLCISKADSVHHGFPTAFGL